MTPTPTPTKAIFIGLTLVLIAVAGVTLGTEPAKKLFNFPVSRAVELGTGEWCIAVTLLDDNGRAAAVPMPREAKEAFYVSGDVNVWVPLPGEKFAVQAYRVTTTYNTTVSGGATCQLVFLDGGNTITGMTTIYNFPGAAATAVGAYNTGFIYLYTEIKSAQAGNALKARMTKIPENTPVTLSGGAMLVTVFGNTR